MQAAIRQREAVWFGWSGKVDEEREGTTKVEQEARLTRVLVDLSREDYEGYYVGFSNRVLWPLFHYRIDLAEFCREGWDIYRRVNERFADQLARQLAPDDTVWIHDYHFIPLGAALRNRGIKNRLGFFLHIPFPVPEVLTALPVHRDLVRALFAYDLIGLQTDKDLLAFKDYIEREAGGRMGADGMAHAFGATLLAKSFPISIDTARVAALAERAVRTRQAARLRESLAGRALIIGADRLDYTKGLVRRFAAIERLLREHPEHHRAVVILQVAPPTREDVPEYQQIRAELDACISRINGHFGEPDLLPVRYLNRHFRQETLFGFYRASRVGTVTPLRDGMNLVAKEFVASQDPEDPGALVLSRFAGAARELRGALIVNPYDVDQVAGALDRALKMSVEERRARHAEMMAQLEKHDIHAWQDVFLETLREAR